MAKRTQQASKEDKGTAKKALNRRGGRDVVHTSLYLPRPMYEALREAAFKERVKIHDIVLEGIGMALRRPGRRT